jgi:hypothetical protein
MRWGETCTHPPISGLKRQCGRARAAMTLVTNVTTMKSI